MAIKLHGSTLSTCTQRVLQVLTELDVPYEFSDVNMALGEHKNPDFIANFQPFGKVPALEDDGLKLFESRAICKYLITKYGKGHQLDSSQIASIADIGIYEQAASVEYSYFEPAISGLGYENIFKKFMGRGDADPAAVLQLRASLAQVLDYYEKVLATRQYLAGNEFSLVDLYHLPWMPFFAKLGLESELTSRPNFEAWWKRASSRPSWQKISQ
ncbi:unnamed protein product [Parascedosporium putredinis]|uniref:glutathione transferase n=1 Tax=Parascedosporium putredinis TaxID=1442378 RepID=A0A9P1HAZ4_9PEZI|nr:unnamed protein product [Parascedosporium putredinis]CAI8005004.1 unnamed protein product [Parascedosporium putredinis]